MPPKRWTKDTTVKWFRDYINRHGHMPGDIQTTDAKGPGSSVVIKLYGSMDNFYQETGFPRRQRGKSPSVNKSAMLSSRHREIREQEMERQPDLTVSCTCGWGPHTGHPLDMLEQQRAHLTRDHGQPRESIRDQRRRQVLARKKAGEPAMAVRTGQ